MKTVTTEQEVQVYVRAGVMGIMMRPVQQQIPAGTEIKVSEKTDIAFQSESEVSVREVRWDGLTAGSGEYGTYLVKDSALPQAQLV